MLKCQRNDTPNSSVFDLRIAYINMYYNINVYKKINMLQKN